MYLIRPICLLDTRTILREAFLFNPRLSVRVIFRFVGMCKLRRIEVAEVCDTGLDSNITYCMDGIIPV